jgi:peptide/nickel transport system permease protein
MLAYLLRRMLQALLLLLGLSVAVFGLVFLAPADPAQILAAQRLGDAPTVEQVAVIAQRYGLDQPWPVQYGRWLWGLLQGDLGYSLRTEALVIAEIGPALSFSLRLGLLTWVGVLLVGTLIGVLAALYRGTVGDHLTRLVALVAVSIPEFWLAFLLILLFAVQLGWLPSFGARSAQHFILPILALGLGHAARLSRLMRSMLLNQLQQDYLRTARAKGLHAHLILLYHALPNLAIPYVTAIAYSAVSLISGSVIIETLFSLPGLGSAYTVAVNHRDLPMIQAIVLLFAAIIVGINLLVDLSYGFFDPRIRLADKSRM